MVGPLLLIDELTGLPWVVIRVRCDMRVSGCSAPWRYQALWIA